MTTPPGTEPLRRVAARAMGSPLRFTIRADARSARRAWELVRRDVEKTESILSRFRTSSALTRANRHAGDGRWVAGPPRLLAMAALVRRAQRVTGGMFDPRIVTRLEALGEQAGIELPLGREDGPGPWLEIDRAAAAVRFAVPIDSGGVGKGLALRWAARSLRRAGLQGDGGLLDAGGDIVIWGVPATDAAWRVGIEDPTGSEVPVAVVEPRPGAIVTSSVRLRRWTAPDGRPVHHLIDPRTAQPAESGLRSVTVAAPDPAWAEIYTKLLFLSGAGGIARAAESRGLVAWWIGDDMQLGMSRRAGRHTIWTRGGVEVAGGAASLEHRR